VTVAWNRILIYQGFRTHYIVKSRVFPQIGKWDKNSSLLTFYFSEFWKSAKMAVLSALKSLILLAFSSNVMLNYDKSRVKNGKLFCQEEAINH